METVKRLVFILKSGALNAVLKPEPVSENTVGPTLGASTVTKGLWSVGLAFAAVLLFMLFYYEFAGIVACVALFANLLLTIGFMVAMNAAFTLPGLAGLVLMLGMAVDANVLIYERIREERERGTNLLGAIRLGYDRAFPTIIDTHLTSIFTAIILYAFGNDNLRGFAVALTLGLVISPVHRTVHDPADVRLRHPPAVDRQAADAAAVRQAEDRLHVGPQADVRVHRRGHRPRDRPVHRPRRQGAERRLHQGDGLRRPAGRGPAAGQRRRPVGPARTCSTRTTRPPS